MILSLTLLLTSSQPWSSSCLLSLWLCVLCVSRSFPWTKRLRFIRDTLQARPTMKRSEMWRARVSCRKSESDQSTIIFNHISWLNVYLWITHNVYLICRITSPLPRSQSHICPRSPNQYTASMRPSFANLMWPCLSILKNDKKWRKAYWGRWRKPIVWLVWIYITCCPWGISHSSYCWNWMRRPVDLPG